MHPSFENLKPLIPIRTHATFQVNDRFENISKIKSIIFDVYGTLLISDSTDLSFIQKSAHHASEVFKASGFKKLRNFHWDEVGRLCIQELQNSIIAEHAEKKTLGIEFPEVDIEKVWTSVVHHLRDKQIVSSSENWNVKDLAIQFECLNNPTWPMPNMLLVLQELSQRGYILGLVSNAQFFTPMVLDFFLQDVAIKGSQALPFFQDDLSVFSYREGIAKPGNGLYTTLLEKLNVRGFQPEEILFVGNDMLNDVYAASTVGFKTALFAGDKRSLRLRKNNEKLKNLTSDIVVTELKQLLELFVHA